MSLSSGGNLTVSGTTTTVNTTNVSVADPLAVYSSGETGTPSKDSGIIVERGTASNVGWIWDESADQFAAVNTTEDGTTAGNVTIASYADIRGANFYGNGANLTGGDLAERYGFTNALGAIAGYKTLFELASLLLNRFSQSE